jgi:chromosome segregation ATPase
MMDFYVPDDDELEAQLAATRTIEQRVSYVKSLFGPLFDHGRMRENYEREIRELQESRNGMREELRNLRVKLGDLDPASRNALDQRYDMLGKMKKARAIVPRLRQVVNAIFDEIEEALKE